jgi:hypothetical protein
MTMISLSRFGRSEKNVGPKIIITESRKSLLYGSRISMIKYNTWSARYYQ